MLALGQVEDVGAVNRAEFDELDAVPAEHVDLFDRVLGYFVGKSTQSNHRLFLGRRICAAAYLAELEAPNR